MSIKELLALDKVQRFFRIIKQSGGIINSVKKIYRFDLLKVGTLVGTDKYGNRYYENNEYMHGANRWIEYSDRVHLDYDASQIPAEWHGWLHYMTDIPPTKAQYPRHRWMIDHQENMTGTRLQYVPYSTTPAKIQSWQSGQTSSTTKQLK
ncbi:NADH dehydrogenase (ubiquinone) B17.2 subunit [Dermatophagoides pteronyssinus]|uniref:NADH dehydrogenase [ubiquinone] 1 alpha subcomplex subunit 12 n=2 Tax=Dermatophagoides pteronyssinus TaxID=6956 RepID=A0A6P6YH85_DERPT|nr:probable NADH dehydrogenase [ubiquinone] 1 alpha subcomplex subunit 12 [Dermatophagoides pteronyssinus]KAH9426123.1 NADH dehydrogenase 1 alpha subcomplex subunit 12 ndufa12/DAP13 [Dermatophagoides pteronyssinus]